MTRMEFLNNRFTSDDLKLPMMHFLPDGDKRDACVVFIHGMNGNVANSYFAVLWAEMLNKEGVGFLFVHNRGYSVENHLRTRDNEYVRCGTNFEIFEESVIDLELALNTARELGYKRLILCGHSLGCNKSIFYIANSEKQEDLAGLILASAPDMHAYKSSVISDEEHAALIEEAEKNIACGCPDKQVSIALDGQYLSSATYVNWFGGESRLDNFPIMRNPERWEDLAKVDVPILTFSGGNEEEMYHHMDRIGEKALLCPDFEYKVIDDTDHSYREKEKEAGDVIVRWVKRILAC